MLVMIDKILNEIGVSVVAKRMNTSIQRINNWRSRGVPLEETVDFCAAVDWQLTPHMLHPKNYPFEFDAVPHQYRQAA